MPVIMIMLVPFSLSLNVSSAKKVPESGERVLVHGVGQAINQKFQTVTRQHPSLILPNTSSIDCLLLVALFFSPLVVRK